MFGHRADSQTVWRFNPRKSRLSRCSDSKCVRGLRAHSGSRGRLPIWTSGSLTLHNRVEPGVLEHRLRASHGGSVAVRADEHAHQVIRPRTESAWKTFVLQTLLH